MTFKTILFNNALSIIDCYVTSGEVSASLNHSKGVFGPRAEAELFNLLSDLKKRNLRVTID